MTAGHQRLPSLARRAGGEALGTGFLVAAVVGSGIQAERLSPGDTGIQLLENSAATAGALLALILALGPLTGAHLNPVVTLVDRALGGTDTRGAAAYVGAQLAGGCLGAIAANVMFDLPAVDPSTQVRSGADLWFAEVVATVGLLVVILGVVRSNRRDPTTAAALAVAGYIGGAYWFTSSTSFANPAVTVGRTLTDTFAGIAPSSAPAFVAAQLVGAGLAVALAHALFPHVDAERIVVPTTADDP